MKNLFFHPDVEQEVKSSFLWYEAKAEGLGDDFIAELEGAYDAILTLPVVWPELNNGLRRYLLFRFPFALIYKQLGENIYVVAVMHQNRKPDYYLPRVAPKT